MTFLVSKKKVISIFLLLWGLCCLGCQDFGCSSSQVVATLQSKTGKVERDFAKKINQWQKAPLESDFSTNDGIRTQAKSTAELVLQEGSLVVMKPKTQLRFANVEPEKKKYGVVIEQGEAQVEARSDDLKIQTGIGMATLNKGSNITLQHNDNELLVKVDIGTAKFVSTGGEEYTLNQGDDILLSIGTAQIVREPTNAAQECEGDDCPPENEIIIEDETNIDTEADTSKDDQPAEQRKDAKIPDDANTSETADFGIPAGHKAVVHAVQIPVAVEIQFENICPGKGHVRIAGKKIWGTSEKSVVLNFPARRSRYEVSCIENGRIGATKKKGHLTILKDTGKHRLSTKAPLSFVDADGRDYKLLYQSKLPTIVIRWPDAPRASGYKLHLTSRTGTKTIQLSKAQHRFASGKISDGRYKFKITVDSGTKRSRTSTMNIGFDNVTPKAILKSPVDGGFSLGASVVISGIALPGWRASVYGKELEMDGQSRFSGTVAHLGNYASIPVKLTHRKRGTHYFLRRAK